MKTIYVSELDNGSWATTPSAFGGMTYPVIVEDDFIGGVVTYDREAGEWSDLVIPPRTAEDDIRDAEAERQRLINYANTVMADWLIDLQLGIISDEDKASLILWRQYVQDVKAVDTSSAPNVIWPDTPE